MKTYLKYSIFIMLLCMAWSCKKDDPAPQPHKAKVYAAGHEINSATIFTAKYWEDGKETILAGTGNKSDVLASDIFVTNVGDIYVVGCESINGEHYARMWKNGKLIDFFPDSTGSEANAIAIVGNDIYVAGHIVNNNIQTACYWKNSTITILDNQNNYPSNAYDICVSGNNVYIAGYEAHGQQQYKATIWKNGKPISFTYGTNSTVANAIFVSGTEVYIAGKEYNDQNITVAKLWKGIVETSLTDGQHTASAQDIFVVGTDIYVVGFEDTDNQYSIAKLWKNGNTTIYLSDGTTYASAKAVFVHNNNVYVGGSENGVAVIWKNGQAIKLTDGLVWSAVESIYVK